jgi:zinc transporter 1/2/3
MPQFSLFLFKFVIILILLALSYFAGRIPLKRQTAENAYFALGEYFSSGVFFGAALLHMLPDAQQQFLAIPQFATYPWALFFCALSFLVLFFLEQGLPEFFARAGLPLLPYLFAIMLMIHALLEGAAIGVNRHFSDVLIIFLAIMAHKASESFALAIKLAKIVSKPSHQHRLFYSFIFMSPLGIVLGTLAQAHAISNHELFWEAFLNALAAGTFLYIATQHGFGQHTHHHSHVTPLPFWIRFLALVTGFSVMASVAIWI